MKIPSAMILVACATAAAAVPTSAARSPVVVELFQSQGCSECPPAQIILNRLADRPDVLALSFAVTYWDQLGWKDGFASPRFTQRQRVYSAHNGGAGVATPQYWINGRRTILGANPAGVDREIANGSVAEGPELSVSGGRLLVGSGRAPADGADV